jgi:hypothetical protein
VGSRGGELKTDWMNRKGNLEVMCFESRGGPESSVVEDGCSISESLWDWKLKSMLGTIHWASSLARHIQPIFNKGPGPGLRCINVAKRSIKG